MGWARSNAVTIFCIIDVFLFIIAAYVLVTTVESDNAALMLGGHPLPTHQWTRTQTAFSTSLLLDFISWLWTVHKDKRRLFYLAFVINGIPVLTYTLLSIGAAPILVDMHGTRHLRPPRPGARPPRQCSAPDGGARSHRSRAMPVGLVARARATDEPPPWGCGCSPARGAGHAGREHPRGRGGA
jgi:hypothetical protein